MATNLYGRAYDAGFNPEEPRDWHGKWSKFAEEARKEYMTEHPRSHGEITELIDNFDEAMEDAYYFRNERDWYARHKPLAKKLFRDKEPIFEKILSATSIQQQPKANVHDAVLAMEYYLTHGNFEGYTRGLGITRKALNRIIEKGDVHGPKIEAFSANLQGDWDKVTIDRWMVRAFFKHPTGEHGMSTPQSEVAKKIVINIAKSIGWKPAELQAVIWNTARYHAGNFNFSLEDFSKHLEKEAAGIRSFLDANHIAHDAKEPSAATVALAQMFLRLLDKAILLLDEIGKFTGDAGFNPAEPRDWHGRWAAILNGVEGLAEHVNVSKIDDLSDDLYRDAKKNFGATDTKQLDSKGQAAANGIVEAFNELQERGLHRPGSTKKVHFIFADLDEKHKGIAMITGHDDDTDSDSWVVNTNGFEFAVKKIRSGDIINFPQMMALKALRENPRMTDEEILRLYYKGCMEHEYAHWIDNSSHGTFSHVGLRGALLAAIPNPYDLDSLFHHIGNGISTYATAVIPEETFAEGFCRWMNDPHFWPAIKQFYDENFGRPARVKLAVEKVAREFNPFAKDASESGFEPYPNPKYLDKDGNVIPDKRGLGEPAKDKVYDVGFNPNEPRDWHGRWTKGGTVGPQMELPLGNEANENDWRINTLNEQPVDRYTENEVKECINDDFPNMHNYDVVGAPTHEYNCIAWAFGFEDKWWNPGAYDTEEVDSVLRNYSASILEGQEIIDTVGKKPGKGRVKIALFEDDGRFCHMCRQLPDGRWTSKFGGNGKTVQKDLLEMEGGMYGEITRIYDMPIKEFSRFRKEHRYGGDSSWLRSDD